MKRFADAAERNRGPILEVLKNVLPPNGIVLEVASGTGQHSVYFAQHLPHLEFVPTDANLDALQSINAWRADAMLPNLLQPQHLDVLQPHWPVRHANVVLCINMIHITPWACTLALLRGTAAILPKNGLLILYGPFRENGVFLAASNAEFDQSLRIRNSDWGVRDVVDISALASEHGLKLQQLVRMPANNLTLTFRKDHP